MEHWLKITGTMAHELPERWLYFTVICIVNPFTTNRLAQVAALASLDDEEHYKKVLKSNQEGKKYLYKELKELGLFYLPTEANFIFIDLKEDAEVIFEKLLKKGVIIRPGKTWGYPQLYSSYHRNFLRKRKVYSGSREVRNF